MTAVEIIAQTFGIIAMAVGFISFQQKERKKVIMFQVASTTLFATNFFLLGAIAGALLNMVAAIRAVVFLDKEKSKADHPAWMYAFFFMYILSYVATFTVFGNEPTVKHLIFEFLPVIGMVFTTIGLRCNDAKGIRKYALLNSPFWLTYDIYCMSIGAIIGESLNILSIVIGMLRHDIRRKN